MEQAICQVEGCDKPRSKRSMCDRHYQRWRKYGDPLVVKRLVREFCSIEGCDRPHNGRGWCKMHYDRNREYGDPLAVYVPRTDLTYAGAHDRVRYRRGSPTQHGCLACGDPAAEWAYDHQDPDQRHEYLGAYRVAYSVKPEHYMPLCVLCHRRFDKGLLVIDPSMVISRP